MRVLRCTVANFRGFESAEVVPRGHVVLVGEPRAGRSDLLAALSKVFEIDTSRVDEFDFHDSDITREAHLVRVPYAFPCAEAPMKGFRTSRTRRAP